MKKRVIVTGLCFAALSTITLEKTAQAAESPSLPNSQNTVKFVNVDSGSSLIVRSKPSMSATVLSKLAKGKTVTVLSESKGWSKIKINGKTGYVSSKYLAANTKKIDSVQKPPVKKVTPVKTITKYVAVDAGSFLNMRNKSSTSGSVIAKLAKGTKVSVLSESKGWSKITANGKTGYVSSEFLIIKTTKPNIPVKPTTKPATPVKTVTKYVEVDAGTTVNMRSKASASASIVAKLSKGTKVAVLSESNGWSKITSNGKTGFVSSKNLVTSKPIETVPKTKYVNIASVSGISMYVSPSTNSSVIINIAKGVSVLVYSESNGWSKIKAYGKTGYVKSTLLSEKKPIPDNNQGNPNDNAATGTIKYVNVDSGSNLNMRSSASVNATIIAKLTRGTAVTYFSESNGWAKVTANGKTGYVSAQFLTTKLQDSTNDSKTTTYTQYNLTLDDMVMIQMAANAQTDNKYRTYIREDALKMDSASKPTVGVVQGSDWNVRGGAGTNFWSVGQVAKGTSLPIISSVKGSDGYTWYEVNYKKTWVNASPDDVKYYLDPSNFVNDPIKSLQFINLSKSTNLQATEVNDRILSGKGILSGKASSFITAGNQFGINEMYLISHALLETGNGSSQLANGVQVNGKTVYNMYGIGAYDTDPIIGGANFAYNAGWFTPEQAIIGGAQFIANGYINAGQNTLYKMRWNPAGANLTGKATHQYATDIGWAEKQIVQIHNLYSLVSSYSLIFEIPVYK